MSTYKELENRLDYLEQYITNINANNGLLVTNFSREFESETIDQVKEYKISSISPSKNGTVVLQLNMQFTGVTTTAINIKIKVGDYEIYNNDRPIAVGVNDVFIMQSVNCIKEKSVDITVYVTPGEVLTTTIYNYSLFVWSAGVTYSSNDNSYLSADYILGKCVLILGVNGDLFKAEFLNMPTTVKLSDFSFIGKAKLGDCAITISGETPTVKYFRLGTDNCLYYVLLGVVANEVLIESGVSHFSVSTFNNRANCLICYIKNEKPYYRILKGDTISSESNFTVNENYIFSEICAVKGDSAINYVVITTKQGTNYLIYNFPSMFFDSVYEKISFESSVSFVDGGVLWS